MYNKKRYAKHAQEETNDTGKEKNKRPGLRFAWLALIPLSILIRLLFSLSPSFVESVYSQGIYPFIMGPVSRLTGIIPLSLWELAIIALVILIPVFIIRLIVRCIKNRSLYPFVPFLANIAVAVSILWFLNTALWELNYERKPLSELAELDVKPSGVNELYDLCQWLIDNTNRLREQVETDENGIMKVSGGFDSVRSRAQIGFDIAAREYPFLQGRYGKPKKVLFSRIMSHTNIIGLYSPWTGEANIDVDIPDMEIPSTVMHEMAHQRGFAPEDEANYIAWVACMSHPDADFRYSGSVMALQYAMNALYSVSPDKYYDLAKTYSLGYYNDLKNLQEYWKQFQGTAKKVANKMNDTYLKLNGEPDGVQSYGRMVDLLLAERRKMLAVSNRANH